MTTALVGAIAVAVFFMWLFVITQANLTDVERSRDAWRQRAIRAEGKALLAEMEQPGAMVLRGPREAS